MRCVEVGPLKSPRVLVKDWITKLFGVQNEQKSTLLHSNSGLLKTILDESDINLVNFC